MLQRPGSSWGFGALLKDTSVVVLKEDTPPTNNPCRTWDSNPQPSAYKSNSLSIRPQLPPHGCENSKNCRGQYSTKLNFKTAYLICQKMFYNMLLKDYIIIDL